MPCFPHGALRSPTFSCVLIGFWRGQVLRLLNAKNGLALTAPGHLPACACMQLLTDMIADPVVKNRVMIDVMNEPDVRGIKCAWTLKHVSPAWRDGLLRACALTCSGLNMQRDFVIRREAHACAALAQVDWHQPRRHHAVSGGHGCYAQCADASPKLLLCLAAIPIANPLRCLARAHACTALSAWHSCLVGHGMGLHHMWCRWKARHAPRQTVHRRAALL